MRTSFICSKKFWNIVDNNKIDIRTDSDWPKHADNLLSKCQYTTQLDFWSLIELEFLLRENLIGRCHKGLIYWKKSLLFLLSGDLEQSIQNLDKSAEEDKLTYPGVATSAINLSSVLKPLLENFDREKGIYKINGVIKSFYLGSTLQEKRNFADALFNFHDNAIYQRAYTIGPSYFGFIVDDAKRKIIKDTYFEIANILRINSSTYYSCVFSMGSVVESMLDDLFEREVKKIPHKIWQEYKALVPSNQGLYPANQATLGSKLAMMRELSEHNRNPLPRDSVMFMMIIGEYRNLIHPNRRIYFEFSPTGYVAKVLFSFISSIAHYYWPRRLGQRIK